MGMPKSQLRIAPAPSISPEHQAEGADERSPEAGVALHDNCVEDQGGEGGPTGSDQEQTGDSRPEASGESCQDEPQGEDSGAGRHHWVGRAAVHPDGCQHHEQSSQPSRDAEKTELHRPEAEVVGNVYGPESV